MRTTTAILIMKIQMDALLDTAPCGFLSFSEDSTILQVNQTLAAWLDYEPRHLENQSLNLLLSMGGRVLYQTHFFPLLKLQGYVEEFYFSLRSESGESIPMLVNSQSQLRAGKTVYDCAFMRMVRRDQYENQILFAKRQAQTSDQAKADILSMLSHEFRTPLNAMIGFTEILEIEMADRLTAEQKGYIAAISSSSEDILRLTSTILEFAELAIGHIKFNLQSIQVPDVLKQVEGVMAPTLSSCGIHYANALIANQPIDHLSPVTSNSVQLQRIIINLLENALEFTKPGGNVSITCSQTEELVQIHISDTGCGVPTEYLHLIFEPFVRVNPSQRNPSQADASAKGIGLGLAISRHLARAMGGDITVISVLGNGSTFTISLPKCDL